MFVVSETAPVCAVEEDGIENRINTRIHVIEIQKKMLQIFFQSNYLRISVQCNQKKVRKFKVFGIHPQI